MNIQQVLQQVQRQKLSFDRPVAGVDEVGRGCLFGPVVAAAVILPDSGWEMLQNAGVTDSKKLSANQRESLVQLIIKVAIDCKIGVASVAEIDRLNILQASLLAMRRSLLKLYPQPELCLVDGNQRIPGLSLPQETIVQGDSQCLPIAAASILAKVWRDQLIIRLADRYPEYDLINNKGYGTKAHKKALALYGASPQHRLSFSPCQPNLSAPNQLSLFDITR
ncbi:ribonuclease HII [Planktothricoides sp. SR001]|nr:ribonuclease HII [Planktothricoides sp. SR001]